MPSNLAREPGKDGSTRNTSDSYPDAELDECPVQTCGYVEQCKVRRDRMTQLWPMTCMAQATCQQESQHASAEAVTVSDWEDKSKRLQLCQLSHTNARDAQTINTDSPPVLHGGPTP